MERDTAIKLGVAAAGVATVVGLPFYAMSTRVRDYHAAYKTVRGKLADADVEPGLKLDDWLPQVEYVTLPAYLQSASVSATENSNINVRTLERARVYGEFDIQFTLDRKDPNFGNIYTELKADEIEDIIPYIEKLAVPAIIDTYRDVTTGRSKVATPEDIAPDQVRQLSLDEHLEIGSRIAQRLQTVLDTEGYSYIKIKRVIPSGVGLSPEANAQLEKIVAEERKLDLLKVQGQVADQSIAISEKQSSVTAKALQALRDGGVPEDQLMPAYYLQLLRDAGKIGEPNVPGPIPGTGIGALPAK